MGIIKAVKQAIGGGFADTWQEVIEPDNIGVRLLCLRPGQRHGQHDRRCPAAAGGAGALPVAAHPHHGHRQGVVCVLGVRGDRLRLQSVGNEKRTAEQGKIRQNKNRMRHPDAPCQDPQTIAICTTGRSPSGTLCFSLLVV